MARTNKKQADFHITHLGRLKGGTVRKVIVDRTAVAEFGQPVYGLQVEMPAKPGQRRRMLHVWSLCDPEGNGPGFLDIQEEVQGHDRR